MTAAHQVRVQNGAQISGGARVKRVSASHRAFMVGARSDVAAPMSRLLDELFDRLEMPNLEPEAKQG